MTKVEASIQPSRFEAVEDALIEVGVDRMTVFEVRGQRQKGTPSRIAAENTMSTCCPRSSLRWSSTTW
jgi:nitrogen regulatory protein PII